MCPARKDKEASGLAAKFIKYCNGTSKKEYKDYSKRKDLQH